MSTIKDFGDKHVAVSSLETKLHATRKDPRIVSVNWFLGKRCNYDCSYCASFFHDNYSPHIKLEDAKSFIESLRDEVKTQNKMIKFAITGGEPFIHPHFYEIAEFIKLQGNCIQLSVTTNGSLPLEYYLRCIEHIDTITVSLHMEKSNTIIDNTIAKIIALSNNDIFLNVNLMALPGKFDKIKEIIDVFHKHNIKFVLRKIIPPYEDKDAIVTKKTLTVPIAELEKDFDKVKFDKKQYAIETTSDRYLEYYSKDELAFLDAFVHNSWCNIKLHTEDDTLECNTDDLILQDANNWQNWKCYIGIDSLYIQHNGSVFRGTCMQGGSIGKIGSPIDWPREPIVCPISKCGCNADMVIRKVKDDRYTGLIN